MKQLWLPVISILSNEHAPYIYYILGFYAGLKITGHLEIEPFDGMFTQGMVCRETYSNEKVIDEPKFVRKGDINKTPTIKILGENVPVSEKCQVKKNIVDPDDIIKLYGADTARWFVLSDSSDRDIFWMRQV